MAYSFSSNTNFADFGLKSEQCPLRNRSVDFSEITVTGDILSTNSGISTL